MRRGQATQVNFTVTAADDTDPRTTVANAAPEHLPDRGHDRELSGPWMRPAQRDGELQVTVQEAADKLADLRPCPRSRINQKGRENPRREAYCRIAQKPRSG